MKAEVVEKMGKQELHQNAKRLGIKYGKLSLMQIREALIASDDKVPTKPKQRDTSPRKGSKVEKCVELYKANSKATRQAVSYTHLRAHETGRNLVCRLLLEK